MLVHFTVIFTGQIDHTYTCTVNCETIHVPVHVHVFIIAENSVISNMVKIKLLCCFPFNNPSICV